MPYISKERVAEIRKQIRESFPQLKISVTCRNYSSVVICITEAPFNLLMDTTKKYESVNHFYIAEHYNQYPEIKEVLMKIYSIANAGNGVEVEDGDYGTVPNFYVNISIGDFDRPFTVVKRTEKATPEVKNTSKPAIEPGKITLVDYSEKAVAVVGDTYPVKDTLRQLGGRFNKFLTCGAGWIFPKTKTSEIKTALNIN